MTKSIPSTPISYHPSPIISIKCKRNYFLVHYSLGRGFRVRWRGVLCSETPEPHLRSFHTHKLPFLTQARGRVSWAGWAGQEIVTEKSHQDEVPRIGSLPSMIKPDLEGRSPCLSLWVATSAFPKTSVILEPRLNRHSRITRNNDCRDRATPWGVPLWVGDPRAICKQEAQLRIPSCQDT